MKKLTKQIVVAVAVIGCAVSVQGVPTLRLTSGADQVTIDDEGALDSSPAGSLGWVTYVGPVGSTWDINVSTGLTKPVPGYTAANGHMDLNSINSSDAGSTLVLEFSETDFSSLSAAANWVSNFGGTLGGLPGSSITYKVWAGDVLFSHTGGEITSVGPFGASPFSGSDTGSFGPSGPYSLTIEVTLTHGTAGTSSFDAETQQVPEGGSTVVLLGAALLALGVMAVRRKSVA